MNTLELNHIHYRYRGAKKEVLNDISLKLESGRLISIIGESGAGKSTLLFILTGLTKPSSGKMLYNGKEVDDLVSYRRNISSLISQNYLLFPERTASENIMYPLRLKKPNDPNVEKEAHNLLEKVNLHEELRNRFPGNMSGGEQQRTAIARCLAADADVIGGDEPTGNLDIKNTREIIEILKHLAHEENKIVVIVTHDIYVAKQADLCYELSSGILVPAELE